MWKNPNPDFIDDFICGGSKCLSRSESGLEQTNLCSVASDQCRWIGDYTAIYPAIAQDLKGTQEYLEKAAQQYRGQPTYFYFNLGRELKELPPKVPEQASLQYFMESKIPFLCLATAARFRSFIECYSLFKLL